MMKERCEHCGAIFTNTDEEIHYWFDCSVCGATYIEKDGKWYYEDEIMEDDEWIESQVRREFFGFELCLSCVNFDYEGGAVCFRYPNLNVRFFGRRKKCKYYEVIKMEESGMDERCEKCWHEMTCEISGTRRRECEREKYKHFTPIPRKALHRMEMGGNKNG